MTQETLDFVKEKTVALIAAHSCSAEAKAAAEKWLAAVGTAKEAEVTKAYIAELEADIMPIDGLIALPVPKQALAFSVLSWQKYFGTC